MTGFLFSLLTPLDLNHEYHAKPYLFCIISILRLGVHSGHRGVLKIEAKEMPHELDNERAQEIVREAFQRKGIAPPYSIDFGQKQAAKSKPQAYLEGNILHITTSTEPELKRLIGRYVIRNSWTPHDWLLLNHTGLYVSTSLVLLTMLPFISYLLAYLFPEFRFWTVAVTDVSIIVFSIWIANQVSRKTVRLLRDFTIEMADLGCMTEYDSKDYIGDFHLIAVGGVMTCLWAALVCGFLAMAFYSQETVFFAIPFIVLLLSALYFLFTQAWTSIGSNLCYQTDESGEVDEEMEAIVFGDNHYLKETFTDLIERLSLRKSLISKHKSEFSQIRARFSDTRYAQCRGVYDYVEEGTLFIDIEDLSLDAARRYGSAVLAKGSLRFYTELSFKRRAIQLIALFFGLFMLMVALVGAFVISKELGIGAMLFTGILFTGMCYIGWRQNEEARRELPQALRKTGIFKEYEVGLYSKMMFSMSSRSDLAFLLGFLIVIVVLGWLILILV
jgi:hypothetical protein